MSLVTYQSRKRALSTATNPSINKSQKLSLTLKNSATGGSKDVTRIRGYNNHQKKRSTGVYTGNGPYRALTTRNRHVDPLCPTPELKYYDSDVTGAAFTGATAPQSIPSAGGFVILNNIEQGLGSFQRIGYQINVKSCSYKYELTLPTGATVPTSGRVILLWDQQSNGALPPLFTTVFARNSYLAFMDLSTVDRFTILRNEQFTLSPRGEQSILLDGYVKINMRSTFVANTATGFPQTGTLLLSLISDQPLTANQPLIQGCWRVRYTDS